MQFENYDFGSAPSNAGDESRLFLNPAMTAPSDKSSNTILPLQLNTVDIMKAQPSLQQQQQQQQQQPPRRNGSDLGLSPNMLLTPGVYDPIPNSNENYTHQNHQHQSSLSSLASMYSVTNPNLLHHGLSGSSSTTVSDSFLINGNGNGNGAIGGGSAANNGNPSYEPITPPDYFPSLTASNFESHSRKSSLNSAMWNQPSNMKQLYSWSSNQNGGSGATNNMNMNMNMNNGHGHGHSLSHMSSGVDLDQLTTVPEIPAPMPNAKFNHMKCASMDDAHQRFSRQKFIPQPNSMSAFEKQFQQLSVSNSNPDLTSQSQQQTQPAHGSSLSISFSHSSVNPSSSSVPIPVASQTHKRSSTLPIAAPNPSLGNSADILNLSKDQYGCRILQKRIDDDFSGSYLMIFHAVYQHSFELMMDPFGNYLIQKIMINASNEELNLILVNVTGLFGTIAKNQHGTRACQKLIDCLSTPMHYKLLEECLTPHIVGLVQDLNGNHVIQKCIQKFENEDLQFIIESICENMIKIATHKHGCCVLQKLLNKCNAQQVLRLGQEIIRNSILLMQDQFGNYVVQYLITLNINSLNVALIEIMIPYIGELSSQKFSSNVVEKCLKIRITNQLNAEIINPLFDALLQPHVLSTLIKDQYGNYVIQTAMEISPNSYKLRFASSIKPLLPLVRFTSFGKRIHNKVVTVLNEAERSEQQNAGTAMEGSLSGLLLNCNNNNISSSNNSSNSSNVSGSDTRSSSCSLHSEYSSQQQQSLLPAFQLNNSASPVSAGNAIVNPSRINDVEKFL